MDEISENELGPLVESDAMLTRVRDREYVVRPGDERLEAVPRRVGPTYVWDGVARLWVRSDATLGTHVVRMLRDGLSRELGGLNEDEAAASLRYARERLVAALTVVDLALESNRHGGEQ